MSRADLPDALGRRFTVRDAAAAGLPRSRLRAADLETPFRGVRVIRRGPTDGRAPNAFVRQVRSVRKRAYDYALIMPPDQFFSHVTAALLLELPVPGHLLLPGGHDGAAFADELDVSVLAPVRAPRVRGIRGHQLAATHASFRYQDGVRISSAASTWAMLASVITSRRDVIALGDAAVREAMFAGDRPPLATLGDLEAAAAAGRRRGIERLRDALPLIRTRSASSRETWCRLALVDAGLPEPELNWNVLHDGHFVACVDLAYPRARIAIEYEGEHHLIDAAQWAKDIERHARLVELGWVVIRVTKRRLDAPAELVRRVGSAISARS